MFEADLFRDLSAAYLFEKRGQGLSELLGFAPNVRSDKEEKRGQENYD